jgi:hypothetical protein
MLIAADRPPCARPLRLYNPSMVVERVHHVQLAMPAGGEARGRAFYQGTLGIPEVVKPGALGAM